jgi:signal transduction histidine kinase
MKQKKSQYKKKSDTVRLYMIKVDYKEVKLALKKSVKEVLKQLGEFLMKIAQEDLKNIRAEIEELNVQLSKDASTIDEI